MEIKSFFKNKNTIYLDKTFSSKDEVLHFFANELVEKKYGSDENKIYQLFQDRENQSSTGIGEAIAIPHIRDNAMKKSTLLFARVSDLDWDSIDGQKVKYIFGIAMSKEEGENSHLEVIAKLSKLLMNPKFIQSLSLVENAQEFIKTLEFFEKKQEKQTKEVHSSTNTKYDVVAVTACPTGIAHTYIAESKLLEAAKEMGVSIKVETQGAEGPKNVLTTEEINNAKGIILAIDREIEKERFQNSNNVVEISTKKAIGFAKQNIEKALNNEGKKIKGVAKSDSNQVEAALTFDGFAKKMYRSMMSGISYMLPFVIFGGIIVAMAFLIDLIAGVATKQDVNSAAFLKNFGSNSEAAKWFNTLGGISMKLIVPVLAAYITFSLVGRQGLLPGFIIGFIASGASASSYGFLENSLKNNYGLDPSGFLATGSGFIGGILGAFFAAAMVIVFSKYVFGKLPKTLQGAKNILFIPVLGTLAIAGVFWALNIIFIYMNFGLSILLSLMQDKPYLAWLLGLILGLMMTFDLGGPVNKAAYIFGTLTISNGNSSVAMAAVMAAGMVPPLGISLSMMLHKKLWSKEDIEAGRLTNILFGISFISEGAIPYTSKNPKTLIPANMIGGAVTGITSALLGANIIAPHGGIFVVFLAKSNLFSDLGAQIGFGILFWILAIIAGAFASAFSYYFLTKWNNQRANKPKREKRSKFSLRKNK